MPAEKVSGPGHVEERYGRRYNRIKVHCLLHERWFFPGDNNDLYDKGDVGPPPPPTHRTALVTVTEGAAVIPAFRLRAKRSTFHDSAVVASVDEDDRPVDLTHRSAVADEEDDGNNNETTTRKTTELR